MFGPDTVMETGFKENCGVERLGQEAPVLRDWKPQPFVKVVRGQL